jgi:hypothetical protein
MHKSSGLGRKAPEGEMHSRLSAWFAESLRLSFFGLTEWKVRPIFEEIVGLPPAELKAQPAMRVHQEWGNVDDAFLNITQQIDRLDVVLSDQPSRNTIDPSAAGYRPLFWIGPYEDSLKLFDGICERALRLVQGATRAAYAISVIRPSSSVRESCAYLHEFLPTVAFNPANDLDLLFQVNRPMRDENGIMINRLGKWESLRVTTVQVELGGASQIPSPALMTKPTVLGARIYVDVSTDAENTSPLKGLPTIVGSLRSSALAIAENGDSA